MQTLDDGEIAIPSVDVESSANQSGQDSSASVRAIANNQTSCTRQSAPGHVPRDTPQDSPPLIITGDLLLNFQRCTRRAFLDKYGSPTDRDKTSDYLRKLQQDSLIHQRNVLSGHATESPQYPSGDWEKGFEATLELMRQGVSHIERGVLLAPLGEVSGFEDSAASDKLAWLKESESANVLLTSRPKVLIRQPGSSQFGDWLYVPADIKLGKRPKADYQVVSAFHSYLLSLIQGIWPPKSLLILRHGNEYRVKLEDQVPKMEAVLADCIEMMLTQQEPSVFISRNRCDLCHWLSHCYSVAQEEEHLSLLPGVTPSRYTHLKSLNLTTVESLAQITTPSLASLPGFGRYTAHKLVKQAQSTHQSRALKLAPVPGREGHPPLQEWIPTAPVELYFDIEAAPEKELIYLHGVVVVDRLAGTETFHGLMAESPDDEGTIWDQFLELTARYPTAPIFHFCPYEAQMVKKLGAAYETPEFITDELLTRFVDLHDRVVQTATMPIESYALKSIAKWVGFQWRDSGANGAQSIFWYDQWLETGDRTYLNSILRYNEDDCLATWKVKDWLVNFLESDEP